MQSYCQSCGMPLVDEALLGTEKGGQVSQDYCTYCYGEGAFKQPDLTVQEMIEIGVPHLKEEGMPEDEARQMLTSFLPSLKRWRKGESIEPFVIEKDSFKVVGVTTRTSNANESTSQAKIPQLWSAFYEQNVVQQISNQVNRAVTYGLYADYESDVNGHYSLTLGMAVSAIDEVPEGMEVKLVPAAKYLVFTSEKGPIPEVVIKAWQDIWAWFANSEVERTYTGDFEKYNERCANPNEAQVDIYIAIK
ncbi:effector binding domain-containing protein [Lysinibacillus sp. NPDC048646]|uniref:effector binding domain-containing protein n=1 Tax=Lysinibacillus sp. NPDC048646 TaxID=3390574 RepID=UPI003D049574